MTLLGIDVGGSGIKGALVDSETGEMISERFRIPTPNPRTPEAMTDVIAEIVTHFDYKGKVGCGFPTIIKNGICKASGNLDPSWLGVNVEEILEKKTGLDLFQILSLVKFLIRNIQKLSYGLQGLQKTVNNYLIKNGVSDLIHF